MRCESPTGGSGATRESRASASRGAMPSCSTSSGTSTHPGGSHERRQPAHEAAPPPEGRHGAHRDRGPGAASDRDGRFAGRGRTETREVARDGAQADEDGACASQGQDERARRCDRDQSRADLMLVTRSHRSAVEAERDEWRRRAESTSGAPGREYVIVRSSGWARLLAAGWLVVLGVLIAGVAIPEANDRPTLGPDYSG